MKEVVKVENIHELEYVYNKIIPEETHSFFKDEMYVLLNSDEKYKSGSFWTCSPSGEGYTIISFEEFKSRYELKIGDTFEHNGFVCRVESEVKKWYKIEDNKNNKVAFEKLCKQDVLDILKLPYTKLTEITNKEFIKQLEENAR